MPLAERDQEGLEGNKPRTDDSFSTTREDVAPKLVGTPSKKDQSWRLLQTWRKSSLICYHRCQDTSDGQYLFLARPKREGQITNIQRGAPGNEIIKVSFGGIARYRAIRRAWAASAPRCGVPRKNKVRILRARTLQVGSKFAIKYA